MRCVYGNRVNLGIVRTNENALWSLGVHDLSVILYLLDEDPDFVTAQGSWSIHEGVQDVVFCFLHFPSGKIAHMHLSWLDPHKMRKMTVVGREKMAVFDDMEPDRKVTVYEKSAGPTGELHSGDIHIPKISSAEPLRLECAYFLELIDGQHDRGKVARDGARVVRALELLTNSLRWLMFTPRRSSTPAPCWATVCECSRTPSSASSRRSGAASTAKREPLPPHDDRRRHDRLDRGDRLCRLDGRRATASSATSRASANECRSPTTASSAVAR